MMKKKKLRDRREWIDDLTEKERRIEWLIKRKAESRKAERKSRKGIE